MAPEATKTRQGRKIPDLTLNPSETRLSAFYATLCACGCGETFTPTSHNQKYVRNHRFKGYGMHRCPDCGAIHRKGKANG